LLRQQLQLLHSINMRLAENGAIENAVVALLEVGDL
jgi:hypothetical protein